MKAQRGGRSLALPIYNLGVGRGVWSMPHPGHFSPRWEKQCPFYRRLGGPWCRSGWVRKISLTPGFEPWTVQLIVSRYTDCAVPSIRFGMQVIWKYTLCSITDPVTRNCFLLLGLTVQIPLQPFTGGWKKLHFQEYCILNGFISDLLCPDTK